MEIQTVNIKPLAANLLRLNVGQYLKTEDFNHLILEHDYDQLWKLTKASVLSNKRAYPGYDPAKYYEEVLIIIIDTFFQTQKEKDCFAFLEIVLKGIINWKKGSHDFSEVIENLVRLGMPTDRLVRLNNAIKASRESIGKAVGKIAQPSFGVDNKLCFVLMPFDKHIAPVYSEVIKPLMRELELECIRADEFSKSNPIIDDILDNIKKARFLVADLTGRNPNVFYELGLAHAMSKEVILLAQNIEDVPFDVRHYRIITYQNSISGSAELKGKLRIFTQEIFKSHKMH